MQSHVSGDVSRCGSSAAISGRRWWSIINGDEVVWLITRSLYGMKQSGRNWYMRLRRWLLNYGFTAGSADPCVFTKIVDGKTLLLGVYVDDMIIAHPDDNVRDE